MNWNPETGYLDYKMALSDLQKRLGIGVVDWVVRKELAPYLTRIIQYLDRELILLGDSADITDLLDRIFEIFDYGADKIVALLGGELAEEVGIFIDDYESDIDPGDDDGEGRVLDENIKPHLGEGPVLDDEDPEDDKEFVEYKQDRFIFCWANVMSSLVTRLKIQYASLLEEPINTDCYCCCGEGGESWKSWESYSSGVYPEDEEYYDGATNHNTSVWTTLSKKGGCTCGYRPGNG